MGIRRIYPSQVIKEAVIIIRDLWDGKTVDFEEELIQCHLGRLNIQIRANIPIIIATRGDMIFKAACEVVDDVMISTHAEPIGIQHALS